MLLKVLLKVCFALISFTGHFSLGTQNVKVFLYELLKTYGFSAFFLILTNWLIDITVYYLTNVIKF